MSNLIEDPLARFYNEDATTSDAGVKDSITGIRTEYNASEHEKSKNEEIYRKQQVIRRVILMLMQNDLGREWVYDQLTLCNVFGTPYTVDPQLTAFNAGALHYGRILESDIKKHATPEFFEMLREGWERENIWNADVADNK